MLASAVDVRRWLQEDRSTPFAERLERDRAIGRQLTERDPVARVLAWWQRLPAGQREAAGPGQRVAMGRRLAAVSLTVLGVLVGGAVAGVALAYDGRHPVNLFTLLGVLVGIPLLMLLATLLVLPGRLPGLGAVQAVAAGMSPGRWLGAWLDRLLGAELFAPGLVGSGSVTGFSRWQLLVFSQWLALGFFAGALIAALLRVTFTDLAFGWSTTLDVDPARVHGWVELLSWPWSGWLPMAAPDPELVTASRFNRLENVQIPLQRAELLGGWWPFVLMCVVCYGALPRLLLLVLGSWRLRAATSALITDDPEVTALLDRLDAPLVELGGTAEADARVGGPAGKGAPMEAVTAEGLLVIVWNQAVDQGQAARWLADILQTRCEAIADLGILQSADEQRRRLQEARQAVTGSVRRVLLITKGWEPPLLEFTDFLGLLREELGGDCSVTVVPIDVAGSAVQAADREVWSRALGRVRDPRLYVLEAAS